MNSNTGEVISLIRDSINDAKEMARESKQNSKEALDVARQALAIAERNSTRHDDFSEHLSQLVDRLEDLNIKIVGDPETELKVAKVVSEKRKGKMWAALAGFFTAGGIALGALGKYLLDLFKGGS